MAAEMGKSSMRCDRMQSQRPRVQSAKRVKRWEATVAQLVHPSDAVTMCGCGGEGGRRGAVCSGPAHNPPEGWTPTVESNCFFVALPLTAMAMPWMISGESGPTLGIRVGGRLWCQRKGLRNRAYSCVMFDTGKVLDPTSLAQLVHRPQRTTSLQSRHQTPQTARTPLPSHHPPSQPPCKHPHVHAHHHVRLHVHDELHERLLVAAAQRVPVARAGRGQAGVLCCACVHGRVSCSRLRWGQGLQRMSTQKAQGAQLGV